jgi:hypothetical protein
MRRIAVFFALAFAGACDNGGAERSVGITATGTVFGSVYFDANGSGARDAGDPAFPGARIRLVALGGTDTLVRATTGADGTFRIGSVPVGSYRIVLDSASAGDSARVVSAASAVVSLLPADSAEFIGAISFPVRNIADARQSALGERIFVRAVALHARTTFSDTTLHFVDTTGAMRATRVRPASAPIVAGDSVVLRGRVAERLGQRVLDDVSVFIVGPTFIPTAPVLSTAAALAGGVAGSLDAALVRILSADVIDTATVQGNFQMTMDDGSGAVTVVLDREADVGFRAPLPAGLYIPGNRFDLSGVLVPTGTGVWRVKPRDALDLALR